LRVAARVLVSQGLREIAMAEAHHETVHFSGRVQGVGFRYSTMQVAKEFEVTGFVKNLPDGRVQLEAEGRPEEVAAFIAAVEERMHGMIRQTERKAQKRPALFKGFEIR
jgi:acylphosphatase